MWLLTGRWPLIGEAYLDGFHCKCKTFVVQFNCIVYNYMFAFFKIKQITQRGHNMMKGKMFSKTHFNSVDGRGTDNLVCMFKMQKQLDPANPDYCKSLIVGDP